MTDERKCQHGYGIKQGPCPTCDAPTDLARQLADAHATIDALEIDKSRLMIERSDAIMESRRMLTLLTAIEAKAIKWANQPNDYDEDTETQIADGNTILALLEEEGTRT